MSQPTSKENLPLPYVEYPYAWLGAFPGFRESPTAEVFFCECQRTAIMNRLTLWPPGIHSTQMMRTGFKLPDTEDFPSAFFRPILASNPSSDEDFMSALQFRERICHQCHRRVPQNSSWLAPSTDAYSTLFRSYRRKIEFEHGVDTQEGFILRDRCSEGIADLVPDIPIINRLSSDLWTDHWESLIQRRNTWKQYEGIVRTYLDRTFRDSMGFPKRGPRLTSETILYLRTVSAFSQHVVVRHHRPKGFRGLSLDIFIPHLSVAIEYQGIQHRKALEHWGGEEALARTQERDQRKANLCSKAGIHLIYYEGNVTFISEHDIATTVQKILKKPNKTSHPTAGNGPV